MQPRTELHDVRGNKAGLSDTLVAQQDDLVRFGRREGNSEVVGDAMAVGGDKVRPQWLCKNWNSGFDRHLAPSRHSDGGAERHVIHISGRAITDRLVANGDDLPFELVEEIIENIRDDMASLARLVASFQSLAHRVPSPPLLSGRFFPGKRLHPAGATSARQWHTSLSMSKKSTSNPEGRFREKRIQDLKAKYPGENNKTDIMLEFSRAGTRTPGPTS